MRPMTDYDRVPYPCHAYADTHPDHLHAMGRLHGMTPAPTDRCRVLEVEPLERLVFSWEGGAVENVGYGSLLRTRVTMTLAEVAGGTRLRVVHEGFDLPSNATAYDNMSKGWQVVVGRLQGVVSDV